MHVSSLSVWLGVAASGTSYSVTPAASSVNEGSSLTFNVATIKVPNATTLYYTLNTSGSATSADFTAVSGSFTITSNAGSFSVTVKADALTEGVENFYMDVRTGSLTGPVVATSSSVMINDTSLNPTYTLSPAAGSVNEGSSLVFNVTTTDVANSTVLYYNLSSGYTSLASRFTSYSGSFTVTSNTGSFTISAGTNATSGDSTTFTMDVLTGSITGTAVGTSGSVTLTDTSPTYALAPRASSLNEGSSLVFDVTTTNVTNSTVLYYNLSSAYSTLSSRFTSYSGSCTITGNASTFSITAGTNTTLNDSTTFTMALLSGSITGTVLNNSSLITLNDASPTYSVSPSASSVVAGSSLSFTVTTTNVPNSTTLYFNLSSGSTSNFTTYSGSFTISGNSGTFSVVTSSSASSSTFSMDVKTGSTSGTVVATSSTVTINLAPGTITWSQSSWQTTGTVIGVGNAAASSRYVIITTSSYVNTVYVYRHDTNTTYTVTLPAATGNPTTRHVYYANNKFTVIGTGSTGAYFAAWQTGDIAPEVSANWSVYNISGIWPGNVQGSLIKNACAYVNQRYVAVLSSGQDSGASEYIIYSGEGTQWTRSTTAFTKGTADAYSAQSMAASDTGFAYFSRNLAGKSYVYNSQNFTSTSAFTQYPTSYYGPGGTLVTLASAKSISITWTKEVGWIWAAQASVTYITSSLPLVNGASAPTSVNPAGGSRYVVSTQPATGETTRVLIAPDTSGTYNWSYSKDGGVTWTTTTAPAPNQSNWQIGAVCSYANSKIFVIDEYWGYIWVATIA